MKKKRFAVEQIAVVVEEVEADTPVAEPRRRIEPFPPNISPAH
ncbi:hypothetical protein SAMN05216386_1727 [Nitrosospira briensis]|uniref:Uncharacterized protein n=1 Tax=Nitrosospira briensis TaxID=35799 RepID=A0A1I5BLQ9_9PROT|nr:hypothetical protein [Nitrosospira briensis]SFN75668.1 hypothetical protein SAMN05216386_1727 [Nitrosospira briensis]